MARLARIIRATIATGLTFAVGVGAVSSAIGVIVALLGELSVRELFQMSGKLAVVAFLLGVAFSGMLVITSRIRRLAELSLPRFAALGAGAGLLYFLLIAINARHVWSLANAMGNLAFLTILGGTSATATLLLARRARHTLGSADEPRALGEGEMLG